jgi:hypothetical protein
MEDINDDKKAEVAYISRQIDTSYEIVIDKVKEEQET